MTTIFDINLETGNLTEFTSTSTDGGDLSASAAAALVGAYGLSCVIDDNTTLEALKSATKATKFRCRFYFDPNSISMTTADEFVMFRFIQGAGSYLTMIYMAFVKTVAGYSFYIYALDDAATSYSDNVAISDAPHYIEIYEVQATNSTSNDGSVQWWVDGVDQGVINSALDNYNRMSDQNWFCILTCSGVDTGTRGTVYFDAFKANNDGGEIGSALKNPYYAYAQQ